MTMYWIYDLPTALLGVLIVGFFVVVSLLGFFLSRPLVRRLLGSSSTHNDVVSYFVSSVWVLYGLALGLIAVATWENFTDADALVAQEAASLSALYRDLDGYPQTFRTQVEDQLRKYVRFVVDREWPAHRRGEVLDEGSEMLEEFEDRVMSFQPAKDQDRIVHAEVLRSLAAVVQQRDLRTGAVGTGLPASLWYVVLIGALLCTLLTYLFWVENQALHALLISLMSAFIALMVFLTAAMDNPFRGQFSVTPDAYQTVLEKVMKPVSGG